MANTKSSMLPLETEATGFSLPDAHGSLHTLEQIKGINGTLIIFMCNHCPFVQLYFNYFLKLEEICKKNNIGIVGINSNNYEKYEHDSPEHMIEKQKEIGFMFPYLVDESQQIAKDYQAMCTPDIYLFNKDLKLYYRGQLDDARPSLDIEPNGADIQNAISSLVANKPSPETQKPSLGCNIKWKVGNEPY